MRRESEEEQESRGAMEMSERARHPWENAKTSLPFMGREARAHGAAGAGWSRVGTADRGRGWAGQTG